MKTTFLPEFRDLDELVPVALRAGFYLGDEDPDITFGVTFDPPDLTNLKSEDIPGGYDPAVLSRLNACLSRVRFTRDVRELGSSANNSDAVFIWNQERIATARGRRILQRLADEEVHVYNVDRHRDRMEGSYYIQARHDNEFGLEDVVDESRRRFKDVFYDHRSPSAYLLGTGPSIGAWGRHDMSDGVVIACNTTILDKELMEQRRPAVVTFADPIFHFGCNSYAARFRQELLNRAAEQNFAVIIPLKYHGLFTSLCPSLADRTIAVPMSAGQPNINLLKNYEVKTTANIATLLMIPIAATLAREVRFLGFDGRGTQETYFWRHNPNTQLAEELETIKSVHPSFFTEVDYADYYSDHLRVFDQLLTEAEANGRTFDSLEPSHITPLRKRAAKLDGDRVRAAMADGTFRVFSINPDYEDDFGHYGPYDAHLRKAVLKEGGDFVTLASTGYEGDAEDWVVPAFTDPSWSLGRERWRHHAQRFEAELDSLLTQLAVIDDETPTLFVMYPGSPRHTVIAGVTLARRGSKWPIHINLFHSHKEMRELDTGHRSMTPTGLALAASEIARRSRMIHVYADSDLLAEAISRNHGVDLPLWPMFSFTNLQDDAGLPPKPRPEELIVYAPGNMQFEKGYDLVARLSPRLRHSESDQPLRLRARVVVRPGTNSKLETSAEVLRRNAEVIEGVITPSQYASHLHEADIVLVPYRVSAFATRTSAVLADALSIAKPVVATEGTWMGHIVEELGIGETFIDGDIEDMEHAIRTVASNIGKYRTRYEDMRSTGALSDDLSPFIRLLMATARMGPNTLENVEIETLDATATMFEAATDALHDRPDADTLNSEAKDLNQKLKTSRAQLRSIKNSVGYRLLQRLVALLRPFGPLYRGVRRAAAKITDA